MPLLLAIGQVLLFWLFLAAYIFTMVPLAIIVALLSPVDKKRERK